MSGWRLYNDVSKIENLLRGESTLKDEVVQYFLVNSDVKMSKGKVAAQVAHAETLFMFDLWHISHNGLGDEHYEWFNRWFHDGSMTKIVLKAKEEDLRRISEECQSYVVIDEGRTEVPFGTMTVVALFPMPKSKAKEIVGEFKLLN